MSQVDLIATKRLPYGTKVYQTNDPFRASDQDARLLIAIGKAKRAPKPEPKDADSKSATYHEQRVHSAEPKVDTKDLTAETDEEEGDAPKAKRKYVRRDLEAE